MQNWVHRLIVSLIFSVGNWWVIDRLIIDISILKYFLIEILILVMVKLLIFVYKLTGIEKDEQ